MNPDAGGVIAGAIVSLALIVLLYVWASLALAAVFRKAGEQGWKGWVPFVNTGTLLGIGGFSPWLVLLVFLPVVGQVIVYVLIVIAAHRINRAFGYGGGMTVLAALLLLIWASVLGFGSARWIGAPPAAGPVRSGRQDLEPVPPLVGGWVPTPLGVPGFGAQEPETRSAAQPTDAGAPAGPWGAAPRTDRGPRDPLADLFEPDDEDDSAVDPEDRAPVEPPPVGAGFAPPVEVAPAASAQPAAPETDASALPDEHSASPAALTVPISSVPGVRAPDPTPEPAAGPAAGGHAEPSSSAAPVWPAPVAWPAPPREPERRSSPEPEPAAEPEAALEPDGAPPARGQEPPASPVRSYPPEDEGFPESSEAVSAVVGAPDAGAPRSARSSVSALYAQPEIPADERPVPEPLGGAAAVFAAARPRPSAAPADPDEDDAFDRTVIARRRRTAWKLVPPAGAPIDIVADVVILGRRPAPDPHFPGAQLIAIVDETRTVSKTHARLELREDTWYVTDLGSTNGVLFATLMGTEVEAQPGQELEAGERFFLGDAEVRLRRSDS